MYLQISRLAQVGGKKFCDVVYAIMRLLLTVCVQRRYNRFGKKGKLVYGTFKIASVICGKWFGFTSMSLTAFVCNVRSMLYIKFRG